MKTQIRIIEKLPNCEYFYRCKNEARYIVDYYSERIKTYICKDCYDKWWYDWHHKCPDFELVLPKEYESRMKEEELAKEDRKKKIIEMLDYTFIDVKYENNDPENGREYWNNIPIMSKKGKYWKWGKVGFLYGMPYIVYDDGSVISYVPQLLDGTKGKIIMVYREWSAGTKISQMEIDCFICGKEMKYGIGADRLNKPYAFAICDIRKEYRTDKFRMVGFCENCFEEVVNTIVKAKSQ